MNLEELIQALIQIRGSVTDSGDYEIYFMHGVRTYRVTGIAFDASDDLDVTLIGKWTNPQ